MAENPFFIGKRTSLSLEYAISKCETYEDFTKMFSDDMLNDDGQLCFILENIRFKNMPDKSLTAISQLAGQADSYFGNILNGKKTNPSRDVLLCFAFTLKATFDETQALLKAAGQAPLYVRRKRDVIIWFGLTKCQSLGEVNENLKKYGFKPLCKDI